MCAHDVVPETESSNKIKECMPKWIHALILADTYRVHRALVLSTRLVYPKKEREQKVWEIRFYAFSYLRVSSRFLYNKKNTSGDVGSESHGRNKKEATEIKVWLSWHLCPLVIFYLSHTIVEISFCATFYTFLIYRLDVWGLRRGVSFYASDKKFAFGFHIPGFTGWALSDEGIL